MDFQPNSFFPAYMNSMPVQGNPEVLSRLSAVERICFEILRVVSIIPNAVNPSDRCVPEVLFPAVPQGSVAVRKVEHPSVPCNKSRAVTIIDPSEPKSKPEVAGASSDTSSSIGEDVSERHACSDCRKLCNIKWKICQKCFRASRRLRNTVQCSTTDCEKRVSHESKSGVCHACWELAHPLCKFCSARLRGSEATSTCRSCTSNFKAWKMSSYGAKMRWTRTIKNGLIGKLETRPNNGSFHPESDQDKAKKTHDEYLEWCKIVAEDLLAAKSRAYNRRLADEKARDQKRDSALSDWQQGMSVEFVPTPETVVEELTDLQKCVSDQKLLSGNVDRSLLPENPPFNSVQTSAHFGLSESCQIPAGAQRKNDEVLMATSESYKLKSVYPVSDGLAHSLLQPPTMDSKPAVPKTRFFNVNDLDQLEQADPYFSSSVDCRPRCQFSGCAYAGVCLDTNGFCLNHKDNATKAYVTTPEADPVIPKTAIVTPSGPSEADRRRNFTKAMEAVPTSQPLKQPDATSSLPQPEAVPVVSKKKDALVVAPPTSVTSSVTSLPTTKAIASPPKPVVLPIEWRHAPNRQKKCGFCLLSRNFTVLQYHWSGKGQSGWAEMCERCLLRPDDEKYVKPHFPALIFEPELTSGGCITSSLIQKVNIERKRRADRDAQKVKST